MVIDHIANRKKIIRTLREELVGPSPQGKEIDCSQPISFEVVSHFYGPWRQMGSGGEILPRDPPCKRYGVGVLYPPLIPATDEIELFKPETDELAPDMQGTVSGKESVTHAEADKIEDVADRPRTDDTEPDTDDFDLSTANAYRPSSMAISFLAEFPEGSMLIVEANGGRYRWKPVQIAGNERTWWLHSPVSIKASFPAASILSAKGTRVPASSMDRKNCDGLDLNIEVFSRPYSHEGQPIRLITVCLINRTENSGSVHSLSLFQSFFKASVSAPDQSEHILAYPRQLLRKLDSEEESLALVYRKMETFAVGHGCSATWAKAIYGAKVSWVSAECMPEFETPSITPDISRDDGTYLEVSMAALAGLVPGDDGFGSVAEVIDRYVKWIDKKKLEIPSIEDRHRATAERHITECTRCAQRMRAGLEYLKNNGKALRAFQLANHAILLQQLNTRSQPRRMQIDLKSWKKSFPEKYEPKDPLNPGPKRGKWRAFQIAFLLTSVQSAVEGEAPDRRTVELIWFPTGGGKTEAYLGLAAFALFMRRLINPQDSGVHVLMRYTLRLLTAQQFQRASALICAMEFLRRQHAVELGIKEFSIGIWVGGDTTPNTRDQALQALGALGKESKFEARNKFLISRCPWCGAEMGPIKFKTDKDEKARGKKPKGIPRVWGYERSGNTVVFKCPDSERPCEFSSGIPVYVIDEDIYERRPSIVVGTVDKFAMIAWRPQARNLFGLGKDGKRVTSPPGLIIQDELHLIAGPLGSIVGLYETIIEELCTDRRSTPAIAPKIICSTATIRRFAEQIKALFARDDVALFPAQGLDADDSFFARYARYPDGSLRPGRIYVGVNATGLVSLQTAQVRAFSSLLQAPSSLDKREQDPWWTLMVFFNSLRELGTTVTLFQSDIPAYGRVLQGRMGVPPSEIRILGYLNRMELTGRLESEKVPEAIDQLSVPRDNETEHAVDVCLASSIIEVGIDIDRLSLMCVVGQPKTTSQYIQVTGRIGRSWWERPGLVATIYSVSKPRDRSHFEKFRSYHEQLYAQVEPTSVTPFSSPVLDRALHAVMASYVRQAGTEKMADSPDPYPSEFIEYLKGVMLPRIQAVDKEEQANFELVFKRRAEEWRRWERTRWSATKPEGDAPLLREAGAYVDQEWRLISWPTPTSMRNVDSECAPRITRLYLHEE
jgi:hypothetical protein